MRSRRGRLSKSRKAQSVVNFIPTEPVVPPLTGSVTMDGTMSGMSDEVYYHHWAQMINILPYL